MWEGFREGHEDTLMSDVKVCYVTTYDILLGEFGELPMKLYALKLTMSFQRQLAHLLSSCLVTQATLLSQHLAEQGPKTLHKSTTMWKVSRV